MDESVVRSVRSRAVLLLGVVFVLGMVCGAALFYVGQRSAGGPGPPGPLPPPRPMDRLAGELDLDERQRQAIRELLDRQRVRLDTLLEEFRQAIRNELRPDQRDRFDRIRPPGPAPAPGHPPPGPFPGPHPPPPPRPAERPGG